jgi:hypothetical protein
MTNEKMTNGVRQQVTSLRFPDPDAVRRGAEAWPEETAEAHPTFRIEVESLGCARS